MWAKVEDSSESSNTIGTLQKESPASCLPHNPPKGFTRAPFFALIPFCSLFTNKKNVSNQPVPHGQTHGRQRHTHTHTQRGGEISCFLRLDGVCKTHGRPVLHTGRPWIQDSRATRQMTLTKRPLALLALVFAVFDSTLRVAHACSCMDTSLCDRFTAADIVLRAKVVSM